VKNAYIFNFLSEILLNLYGAFSRDHFSQKRLLFYKYKKINPRSILDIGCGTGIFYTREYDYIGIDMNFNYVTYCKSIRKIRKVALMDCGLLGFKNETLDVILMSSVGHHISDDNLEETILETKRVLKKNGYLLFFDVVKPLVNTKWLSKLLETLDEGSFFRNEKMYIEMLSQYFTLEEKLCYRENFYKTIFLSLRKKENSV